MRTFLAVILIGLPSATRAQVPLADAAGDAPASTTCSNCLSSTTTSGTWFVSGAWTGPATNGVLQPHFAVTGSPGPKGAVVTSVQVTQNTFNYCTFAGPASTNCALTDYTSVALTLVDPDIGETRTFTVASCATNPCADPTRWTYPVIHGFDGLNNGPQFRWHIGAPGGHARSDDVQSVAIVSVVVAVHWTVPDFGVSVVTNSPSGVPAGVTNSQTVGAIHLDAAPNAFATSVDMAVSGLPPGVTWSASPPAPFKSGRTVDLILSTTPQFVGVQIPFTVTASNGAYSRAASASVGTITAFTMSLSGDLSLHAGTTKQLDIEPGGTPKNLFVTVSPVKPPPFSAGQGALDFARDECTTFGGVTNRPGTWPDGLAPVPPDIIISPTTALFDLSNKNGEISSFLVTPPASVPSWPRKYCLRTRARTISGSNVSSTAPDVATSLDVEIKPRWGDAAINQVLKYLLE
jgi:hypothetical protein